VAPGNEIGAGHFFARNGVFALKKSAIGPPKRLSAEARKSWQKIVDEYQIVDDTGLIILTTAFEAFDRMRIAQEQIKLEGMTSIDRFGRMKAHPLLTVERDARAQFLAALKQLNLDIEPLADRAGRPDGGAKQPIAFPGARSR
jgi:P27 family predicted phage terminase small subunit